ncbi:MAG: bifunctional methylenetetrahydrofolate dehydrogenase/methenyltetrahydrofolate cyclohydrolase, partial [Candidatus Wildermuthbacteria bacterium]|nr:bifunctional methylenetetrahydrofolate dehydrogenase/methenyltetrahydrofolate cyclohydrolase [Candidatus Wildermuthbacteria bacterium]
MTDIVAGRLLAAPLIARLKKRLASRRARLSIVQVGDNPASLKFVQEKEKACTEIGIEFELIILPLTVSQEKAEDTVRLLAKNP